MRWFVPLPHHGPLDQSFFGRIHGPFLSAEPSIESYVAHGWPKEVNTSLIVFDAPINVGDDEDVVQAVLRALEG